MPKFFRHHQVALILTLGLGLSLTSLATFFVSQWEISKRQLRFQKQIENLWTTLQRSLNRNTELLVFLNDYYGAHGSTINRRTFASFVRRSLQTYPSIQALEWAPLVQQANRLDYERKIQLDGYPGFKITELGADGSLVSATPRTSYMPVTYVEPLLDNELALGYDLASDLTRAAAIAKARDTGKITATGRIRLVQEKGDRFGFLVFQPTYQQNPVPTSLALRRSQFTGVLLGVFRVSDVVEESLQGLQSEIDFTIYDRSASADERFLARYDAIRKQVIALEDEAALERVRSPLCPSTQACTQTLAVGQRQWSIVFFPSDDYAVEPHYSAIATFMVGLLLTISLVMFLHQLNRELEQAQSLNNLRMRFFSIASHELRTPLSTILLSSESLQINHQQLSEEQKQTNIRRIYSTAKRMSQQIADLLMLTRAEVKQLEFQPELIDLERFCQQIVHEMQMDISQPIRFTSAHPSIRAFLDKKLLRSLLTNLLSNAAKYSPPESSIDFCLNGNTNMAIVQICDRGIGIPAIDRPQICQPFYRGSNVGEVTGTGLGLAIVKTCVEIHCGEWAIESQENLGTTVTVKFPIE
jgi:signal transduction histidine kinase